MKNIVMVISSNKMGEGDEQLSKTLIKAFLFTATQSETKPNTMIFYNSGAFLTCEGSEVLEDLSNLEKAGVEIITCGTCLDFYNLQDKIKVGQRTNMGVILDKQLKADIIIKP